ncbi:SufD family Fe-S cluster assembly protein [Dehalogenimonas sp. 4OHTPN]|uniref:SufD family Fe-S cluster assembly protein n=1 Tax=Dehalogenimonas sp. 4OHTPN TaxID=3166643 RepID=A0AAU8G8U1_9CHLR
MSDLQKVKAPDFSERARAAAAKKAAAGPDIDLDGFKVPVRGEKGYLDSPETISEKDKSRMLESGIMLDDRTGRSGTFVQMDNTPVHFHAAQQGIEVMSISAAWEKYDWLKDYWWKAVAVDADKYTAHVELHGADGYFIRALPGVKTDYPVQACLYLEAGKAVQDVHNIIIAEEGSELHIITGCAVAHRQEMGLHLGVSEFYIKKGAKITFSMIHTWSPETEVRPRTGAIIEEDGLFLSNYVIMKPVHSIQASPIARCVGKNATVRFNSIMVATPGSHMDLGSRAFLNAPGARTEMIARAITAGGEIVSRGYMEGNAPDIKGHLECRGLILKDNGSIHAIPELKATVPNVDLSHEAAVGKIAEDEVEYLMARGLTRDEATAAIIRGFLKVDIEGLPPMLNAELRKAVEASEKEAL